MSDTESSAPSSYADLIAVMEALPVLVREKRRRLRMSCRAAERATGIGISTFSRVENGEGMALTTALDLLRWVGAPDQTEIEEQP